MYGYWTSIIMMGAGPENGGPLWTIESFNLWRGK